MNCSKNAIGRIIGKNGKTLKLLQLIYNVQISVCQDKNPCIVKIYGTCTAIERTIQSINLIVTGINPIEVIMSKSFS